MHFLLVALLFLKTYIVHFEYRDPQADSVFLAGSFNNWNSHALRMKKDTGGLFYIDIPLDEGIYQYKFVVNGTRWVEDPTSNEYAPDGFGGRNSVIRVPCSRTKELVVKPGDGVINLNLLKEFNMQDARFINIAHDTLYISPGINPGDIDSAVIHVNTTRFVFPSGHIPHVSIPARDTTIHLKIILYDLGEKVVYFDSSFSKTSIPHFETPSYLDTTIFYQIFPERFYNGEKSNDPEGTKPWKYERIFPPWGWSVFYGGDLEGVLKKLPYLKELGINAIYFNPIFTSPSNHKYNTVDYFHVDPHFGGDSVFYTLLNVAHSNGIKIVLDGVFNHTSDEHPFFKDVREKGPESPYYSYYIVKKWPFPPRFDSSNKPSDYYECWWGFGSLPKLNYKNPEVVSYVLGIAKYWEKKGIDGFRLDVPNEVPHFFWKIFRDTVRFYNPDFYIVGEIWGNPHSWLSGNEFDGTMNYPLRGSIISYLNNQIDAEEFVKQVKNLYESIPYEARRSMLNILSTHDTRRIKTVLNGNEEKVKLAYLLSFTMPGVPCIYYGDEIGVEGEKDPDSRRVFPWDSIKTHENLLNFFKKLIVFRKSHPELANGTVRLKRVSPACLERKTKKGTYVICMNRDNRKYHIERYGKIIFRTRQKDNKNIIYPYEGMVFYEN